MKRLLLCILILLAASSALAQTPAMPPSGTIPSVEVDPIRCWWRTSAGFVRTGETFDLSLTCALLDTEEVQAVPDESRLGPAIIQMAPFEVVGGSHPADLRSGSRRFFQYHYTLRIISSDAIGKDVSLPPIAIHYTINSQVATRTAVEGRDLVYFLPEQLIRVASMVPADAADIRDAAGEDFRNVESLSFRSRVLEIASVTSLALGALLTATVLVGYARRTTRRTPADERLLPARGVAGAAVKALAAIGRERDPHGWSEALAGRALTATRLAAACAIGRPASQRLAAAASTTEGRLVVSGPMRGKARALFSPLTAVDLKKPIERSETTDPARAHMLETLRDALAAFSATQYGRQSPMDQTALDGALAEARAAALRVKSEHSWLNTFFRKFRNSDPAHAQA